jgi:hypothetical protein
MRWVYDDGGRAAAGFKGEANDCVVRSASIVTGRSYRRVWEDIAKLKGGNPDRSTEIEVVTEYLATLGLKKIHPETRALKLSELSKTGRFIVALSNHATAVIDGTIRDIWHPNQSGRRYVYRYWHSLIPSVDARCLCLCA